MCFTLSFTIVWLNEYLGKYSLGVVMLLLKGDHFDGIDAMIFYDACHSLSASWVATFFSLQSTKCSFAYYVNEYLVLWKEKMLLLLMLTVNEQEQSDTFYHLWIWCCIWSRLSVCAYFWMPWHRNYVLVYFSICRCSCFLLPWHCFVLHVNESRTRPKYSEYVPPHWQEPKRNLAKAEAMSVWPSAHVSILYNGQNFLYSSPYHGGIGTPLEYSVHWIPESASRTEPWSVQAFLHSTVTHDS